MEDCTMKILDSARCPITCIVDGEERNFENGNEAYMSMIREDMIQGKDLNYSLLDIKADGNRLVISLKKHYLDYKSPDMEADWVKQFVAENGRYPDLFDGA